MYLPFSNFRRYARVGRFAEKIEHLTYKKVDLPKIQVFLEWNPIQEYWTVRAFIFVHKIRREFVLHSSIIKLGHDKKAQAKRQAVRIVEETIEKSVVPKP